MNIDFEKEIESITAQIIKKYKPEKIILFLEVPLGGSSLQIMMWIF